MTFGPAGRWWLRRQVALLAMGARRYNATLLALLLLSAVAIATVTVLADARLTVPVAALSGPALLKAWALLVHPASADRAFRRMVAALDEPANAPAFAEEVLTGSARWQRDDVLDVCAAIAHAWAGPARSPQDAQRDALRSLLVDLQHTIARTPRRQRRQQFARLAPLAQRTLADDEYARMLRRARLQQPAGGLVGLAEDLHALDARVWPIAVRLSTDTTPLSVANACAAAAALAN